MQQPSSPDRHAAFERLRASLRAQDKKRTIMSSGIPALDALLSGGMPRGGIAVIEGGVGARALTAALIAGISGYTVAIVDDATLCPGGLVGAGVRLERVIVVPGRGVSSLVLLRAVDAAMRGSPSTLPATRFRNFRSYITSARAAIAGSPARPRASRDTFARRVTRRR
jgi:hypothetical protein